MAIIMTNDGIIFTSSSADYLVKDDDYVKLIQSEDLRRSLLSSMDCQSIIIGRVGVNYKAKFINYSDKIQIKDFYSRIPVGRDFGIFSVI